MGAIWWILEDVAGENFQLCGHGGGGGGGACDPLEPSLYARLHAVSADFLSGLITFLTHTNVFVLAILSTDKTLIMVK